MSLFEGETLGEKLDREKRLKRDLKPPLKM